MEKMMQKEREGSWGRGLNGLRQSLSSETRQSATEQAEKLVPQEGCRKGGERVWRRRAGQSQKRERVASER